MKKTLILALAALAAAGSAQAKGFDDFSFGNDKNGLSFIGQFGLNVSNLRTNDLPAIMGDTDPKAGFNTGIHVEYILPQCYGVYINGGLEYSMKGAKHRPADIFFAGESDLATGVARPMYLSIPIHVGYRYNIMDDLGVYADLGPYFALGTNGKHIYKLDLFGENPKENFFNSDILFDGDPNTRDQYYQTKRGDIGFGFRVGAEYAKHYNLIISCDWGLTDMLTQKQKNVIVTNPVFAGLHKPTMKNFAAGITFGYRF